MRLSRLTSRLALLAWSLVAVTDVPAQAVSPAALGAILTPMDGATVESSRSISHATPARIIFVNQSGAPVDIYWIAYDGKRIPYRANLAAGAFWQVGTFLTHPWLVVASGTGGTTARDTGIRLAGFEALTADGDTALITGERRPAPSPLQVQDAQPNVTRIRTQDFLRTDGQGVVTVYDPAAPVSFELPAGWLLTSGTRWGDHETTLVLYDQRSHLSSSVYYQYPIQTPVPFDLDAALVAGMERKVKQRQDWERFRDYHIRAHSEQTSVVDGRPAFSYVGDFTNARGQAFSEYNMRVIGANTKIEFFAILPVPEEPRSFAARIAPLIHSLQMP